jgi:hypothetical protein
LVQYHPEMWHSANAAAADRRETAYLTVLLCLRVIDCQLWVIFDRDEAFSRSAMYAPESGNRLRYWPLWVDGVARRAWFKLPSRSLDSMRYELTDYEWATIKPFLPNKPRGVPRVNDRRVLNGIFWVLRSGAPWRDLPDSLQRP